MNKFERYHPIELIQTENKDIIEDINPYEIPDHLIYKKDNETNLIFKNPSDDLLDEETPLGKKYKKAKELCNNVITIDLRDKDEKSKSKTPKRKLKKINLKSNSSAVASIQKKLP